MSNAGRAKGCACFDLGVVGSITLLTSVFYYIAQELLWRAIPPFDSSHTLSTHATSPGLRWDSVHFLTIAKHGYQYEQQVAFQPAWQGLLHLLQSSSSSGSDDAILRGAVVVNSAVRVMANVYLYKLTRATLSRRMALAASLLYAFPPAPAVLSAPFTEPLYAFATFSGLYSVLEKKYLRASVAFALATSVRATGVFATLPLGYAIIIPCFQDNFRLSRLIRSTLHAGLLALIVTSPFVAFQAWTWKKFCNPAPSRPWCLKPLPLSYGFVQANYWGIGLFRYWRVEQLPNLLLASPVLLISMRGVYAYFKTGAWKAPMNNVLTSIVIHQAIMNGLLLFASHTQIALRLAPTDPVLWWTLAASLQTSSPFLQSHVLSILWAAWVCLWGAASLALWSGHYPPA